MPDTITSIAMVICPEAWDRDAFRRIVKASNDGHTAGVDIAASMQQAQSAARVKAVRVLAEVRRLDAAADGEDEASSRERMETALAIDQLDAGKGMTQR